MKVSVQEQVKLKALHLFGRAPSSSKEPIYVCSQHCAAVVEGKKWIKSDLLKLALTRDAPPLSRHLNMNGFLVVSF